ncbi:MAG: thiamine-phosphate kinase [Actinomycetota bacterium]|nr:thiamine-phosphate kinase [Actinomycetota bacterium]
MSGESTVSSLGEVEVLRAIAERMPPPPPGETWGGDDTAIFPCPGPHLLFTIDMLVEGLDFDLAYCSGEDVGWKAMAATVSDIASMGGRASRAVTSLSLPPGTELGLVSGLCDGLVTAAREWEVGLSGGDLSGGDQVTLSVALLGLLDGPGVHRSGAREGEAICVTGSLGGAAAGLRILRDDSLATLDASDRDRLAARQRRPRARLKEGDALRRAGVTAMIDVSDGLAVDLSHLCDASALGCSVDAAALPIDPALDDLDAAESLELAVIGGEDFELLFTIESDRIEDARRRLAPMGTPITPIGTMGGADRTLGDRALDEWRTLGWEHLRDP